MRDKSLLYRGIGESRLVKGLDRRTGRPSAFLFIRRKSPAFSLPMEMDVMITVDFLLKQSASGFEKLFANGLAAEFVKVCVQ